MLKRFLFRIVVLENCLYEYFETRRFDGGIVNDVIAIVSPTITAIGIINVYFARLQKLSLNHTKSNIRLH